MADLLRKTQLTQLSDKEIENAIRGWLDIPHFSVRRIEEANAFFSFAVTDPQDRAVAIVRKKADPSQLLLAIKMRVSSDIMDGLMKLDTSIRSDLFYELRVEMAQLGVGYEGVGWPLKEISLSGQP
ncbi:MAG: DUF2299 family protein, partial [Anaerolineales bacterium]|nr:DUF2299 family protein [Anaerolineales bacterium]